jgi:hypothetical protein
VRAVVLLVIAAVSGAIVANGAAGGSADFGIRLAGPADATGNLTTGGKVVAGVPFRLRLELTATGFRGAASVGYEVQLPTGVHLADAASARTAAPLDGGLRTSTCLHACTVGWDPSRGRRLFVYYVLVVPVAAEAMLSAHLTSTNHPDANVANDRAAAIVRAVPSRLTLGAPQLVAGAPRASRRFAVSIPVLLDGKAVRPQSVRCRATAAGMTLFGVATRERGFAGCAWALPGVVAGVTLRATAVVTAGLLRASGTWLFAVAR